jgi:transforming growth factor-beta-induced protein
MKRLLMIAAMMSMAVLSASAADIVDTAANAGSFKTLLAAAKAAGLVDTLKSEGPFTVFAPTDAAFAKLPAGTVDGLLKDPEKLKKILLYHVSPGMFVAAQVTQMEEVKTVEGSPAKIKKAKGKVYIEGAEIVKTDILTDNGVIHVIDAVILPPQ